MGTESDFIARVSCYNEARVQDYFEGRGFGCERLDRGTAAGGRRPDFRFSRTGCRFLCEVKTIFSVVGDESVFRTTLHEEFEQSFPPDLRRTLPYWFALTTPQTRLPSKDARRRFWRQLSETLRNLDPECLPIGRPKLFRYPWDPIGPFDGSREFRVWVYRKPTAGIPPPRIPVGGAFSFAKEIEEKVDDALDQLNQQAAREDNVRIPRLVVLASETPFPILDPFEHDNIVGILEAHPGLSVIAILHRRLRQKRPFARTVEEWKSIAQLYQTPGEYTDFFVVYHNTRIDNGISSPLDRAVFDDRYSTQYPLVDTPMPS